MRCGNMWALPCKVLITCHLVGRLRFLVGSHQVVAAFSQDVLLGTGRVGRVALHLRPYQRAAAERYP
jgi:hypothetical protein